MHGLRLVLLLLLILWNYIDGFHESSTLVLKTALFNSRNSEGYDPQQNPQTFANNLQKNIHKNVFRSMKYLSILGSSVVSSKVKAAEGLFIDPDNKFSLLIPPHWSVNDKKFSLPSPGKFLSEQILFSAVNVQDKCSMSVTKSEARRLLKDFDIEYWFAPLETIADVGSAEIISKLLILQRDEAFEKKASATELLSANFIPSINNALLFSCQAPIDDTKMRETIAKTIYLNGQLYTLWISSRPNVIHGEYGEATLKTILQSFTIFS